MSRRRPSPPSQRPGGVTRRPRVDHSYVRTSDPRERLVRKARGDLGYCPATSAGLQLLAINRGLRGGDPSRATLRCEGVGRRGTTGVAAWTSPGGTGDSTQLRTGESGNAGPSHPARFMSHPCTATPTAQTRTRLVLSVPNRGKAEQAQMSVRRPIDRSSTVGRESPGAQGSRSWSALAVSRLAHCPSAAVRPAPAPRRSIG